MRFLLDTNVVSEIRKPRPHGAVLAWLNTLRDDEVLLPAVVLGELQAGVERTRRQDPAKAAELDAWIDTLAAGFQIIPMDAACFREWARLMSGTPTQLVEDAMTAATARVHGLTVATRNVQDFHRLGVKVFNPFQP